MKKLMLVLAGLLLGFTACVEDVSSFESQDGLCTQAKVEGHIYRDCNTEPIEGATVTLFESDYGDPFYPIDSTQSDENGFYRLPFPSSGLGHRGKVMATLNGDSGYTEPFLMWQATILTRDVWLLDGVAP